MASAFSKAPVMGGRSWLAEGSLIMGMHVGYEALFRQVVDQIDRVPNLVSFLKRQGYRTVLLAPADRVRPGVEAVNYYHYDQTLGFDDLHYRGPPRGWGLVPDQYSLGYVDEHVLAQRRTRSTSSSTWSARTRRGRKRRCSSMTGASWARPLLPSKRDRG